MGRSVAHPPNFSSESVVDDMRGPDSRDGEKIRKAMAEKKTVKRRAKNLCSNKAIQFANRKRDFGQTRQPVNP
jgi:hypothetical protein